VGSKTDYQLLAVVGAVGLLAILIMVGSQQVPEQPAEEAPVIGTGRFVGVLSTASRLDFTGDGRYTFEDALLLSEAILRGHCPQDKVCDINGDGVLDMYDVSAYITNYVQDEPVAKQPSVKVRSAEASAAHTLA
jgi:hypothetical protein